MSLALPLMLSKILMFSSFLLVQLLLQLSIIPSISAAPVAPWPMALPGCPDKCGNISIPYPFGIGRNCFHIDVFDIYEEPYQITCNNSFSPPKAFLQTGDVEVIDISISPAEVRVYNSIARNCIKKRSVDSFSAGITIHMPFRFSNKRNKFTALGCYTLAYFVGETDQHFSSGCASFCDSLESTKNGSCAGIGCCQTVIPKDVNKFEMQWGFNTNPASNVTPCSYAMLVEDEWYNFTSSDLLRFDSKNKKGVPVVLDWSIGDLTCQVAKGKQNYACRSRNSDCYESAIGVGYLCNCSKGYKGNPYLDNGCIDINECEDLDQYPCHGKCANIPGGYNCTCPQGSQGNPLYENCIRIPDKFPFTSKLAVGDSITATMALAPCSLTVIKSQKRRHKKEKDEYFKQNGGLRLYEEMRSRQVDTIRIFTEKDLEKATNNFDKERILGCGGHGMVFKGILKTRPFHLLRKKIQLH